MNKLSKKIVTLLAVTILTLSMATLLLSGCAKEEYGTNLANGISAITSDGKRTSALTDNNSLSSWNATAGSEVTLNFGEKVTFNTIILKEKATSKGYKTSPKEGSTVKFSIYALQGNDYSLIYRNDKIDNYRLCYFDSVTTVSIKLVIDESRATSKITDIGVYNRDKVSQSFRVNDYFVVDSVANYTADNNFKANASMVTDLTLFCNVWLTKEGGVHFRDGEEVFAERIQNIKTALVGQNKQLYVNVFSDSDGMTFFEGKTQAIATNLATFVTKYDLAGVDIDWEYPESPAEWSTYNKLVIDIHNEFAKINKKLSVATVGWNANFSKTAREAIDYYNVMVYDLVNSDANGYHSTFKHATLEVDKLLKKGYSANKLCLGLPFYGREINHTDSYWLDYGESGITSKWDNVSTTAIHHDKKTNEQSVKTGYFNGYAIICDKTLYAIDKGLGGVMTWSMTSDMQASDPLSLHRAIAEVVKNRLQ